ncbi:hypothetical protein [Catellatospora vulcania]|uniref:hypothetical protein n=1 Tax=Catellatospora vulcania TaxID=1460450 RepID=UPI0012D45D28|nr:hypothetical protein [Catellatospora vulcania]
MSDPDGLADKRAKWQRYFEGRLTGSDAEVRAATDAAMEAIGRRADVDGVIAAGLAAARQFRTTGAAPAARPAAPPPPRQQTAPHRQTAPRQAAAQQPAQQRPAAARTAPSGGGIGSDSSGVVNGLQQRQEMIGRTYFTVWNFRLERTDAAGRGLPPIPVEMKGRYFNGAVANGDLVDIGRGFRPGKLVRTNKVHNVTAGIDVTAVGRQFRVLRGVFIAIFLVIFVCIAALIISQIVGIASGDLPEMSDFPDP